MTIDPEELLRVPGLVDALGYDFVAWAVWAVDGQIGYVDDFMEDWNSRVGLIAEPVPGNAIWYSWSLWRTPIGVMIGGPDLLIEGGGPHWVFVWDGYAQFRLIYDHAPLKFDPFEDDDENAMALIMGRETGTDPDDFTVEYENGGAHVYTSSRRYDYLVFPTDEALYDAAVDYIRDQLNDSDSVGHFEQSWLMRQVDDKKLKDAVREMARSDIEGLLEDQDNDELRAELERWNLLPDDALDDEGEPLEDWEPSEKLKEELIENMVDDRVADPMRYLEEMYSEAEAIQWVLDNVGFDVDAAAKDAVDADGPGHFLGHHDGEVHYTDPTETGGVRLPYVRQ